MKRTERRVFTGKKWLRSTEPGTLFKVKGETWKVVTCLRILGGRKSGFACEAERVPS